MQKKDSGDADFARGMKSMRERLGKSQQWVAEQMIQRGHDWHQSTVYKSEAGSRRVSIGEAASLSEIMNAGVDDLLTWADNDNERDIRLLWTLADNFLTSLLRMEEAARDAYGEKNALQQAAERLDSEGFSLPAVTSKSAVRGKASEAYKALLEVDDHEAFLRKFESRWDGEQFAQIAGETSGIIRLAPLPWSKADG